MARAARVAVSRAGSRGRGGERRGRDCDFVLSGRGLSGALQSDSDTMCDVCDAALYKNSIVPASNDTKEPIFMRGFPKIALKNLERRADARPARRMHARALLDVSLFGLPKAKPKKSK